MPYLTFAAARAAWWAGRGIDFAVDARYDGIAFFDEQKLMRVFHNLTSNAIDALPEGGHLRVVASGLGALEDTGVAAETEHGDPRRGLEDVHAH